MFKNFFSLETKSSRITFTVFLMALVIIGGGLLLIGDRESAKWVAIVLIPLMLILKVADYLTRNEGVPRNKQK